MTWYPRDASFWRFPSTGTPTKLHLGVREKGGLFAACGTKAMLLWEYGRKNPPEIRKCKRCLKLKNRGQYEN